MRIIFMGTPTFSVPILKALHENYKVVAVVTQPDKEVGRKRKIQASPVKVFALNHDIPVVQPIKIRSESDQILAYNPDLIVTAAYGQILPKVLLETPKYKAINVHASLLPSYRGGAPIQRALMALEKETGITIMQMVKAMDAGPIFIQESLPILPEDTTGTLFEKLSYLGQKLLIDSLPKIINQELKPIPQDDSLVTYAPNLTPEDELLDFDQEGAFIDAKIRALQPMPYAYTKIEHLKLKIIKALFEPCDKTEDYYGKKLPGTVLNVEKDFFTIQLLDGVLAVHEVQLEGKKPMSVRDFMNGTGRNLIKKDIVLNQ